MSITLLLNICGRGANVNLDDTVKCWQTFGGRNERIILLTDEKKYFAKQTLLSIEMKKEEETLGQTLQRVMLNETADLLCYIQSDVYILPGLLDKVVQNFAANPAICMLVPRANRAMQENFSYQLDVNSLDELFSVSQSVNAEKADIQPVMNTESYCVFLRRSEIEKEIFKNTQRYDTDFYIFQQMAWNFMCSNGKRNVVLGKNFWVYRDEKLPLANPYESNDKYIFEKMWNEPQEQVMSLYYDIRKYFDAVDSESKVLYIGDNAGVQLPRLLDKCPQLQIYVITNSEYYQQLQANFAITAAIWDINSEQEFPYQDVKFDKIIIDDVFQNGCDVRAVLQRLKNVLATGGELILSVRNIKSYCILQDISDDVYALAHYGNKRFFSKAEITDTLQTSGYDIESIETEKYFDSMVSSEETARIRQSMGDISFMLINCYLENRHLSALLRKIEYNIDAAENSTRLAALLQAKEIGYMQLAHYIEKEVFYKRELFLYVIYVWCESNRGNCLAALKDKLAQSERFTGLNKLFLAIWQQLEESKCEG